MTTPALSRTLILLLVVTSAAAILVSPLSAKDRDGTVSVTLTADAYTIQSTDQGDEIFLENFGRNLVPGKPDLPARIFAVAVPPGAEITGVTFDTGTGITLTGEFDVPPAGLPRVIGEEDPGVYAQELLRYNANYQSVYGSDDPYPSAAGEFVRTAGYRKYGLADVRYSPFAYSPKSGKLVFYPSLTVNVSYTLPDNIPPSALMYDRQIRAGRSPPYTV